MWEPISPSMIKHYYQRARFGHSHRDTWDVDHWLIDNLIPMIKILRDRNEGIPVTFIKEEDGVGDDGNPTDHAVDLAGIRWRNTLGEILYGLKCAKALQELSYDYNDENKTKLLKKRVEKTFTLIGKHLFALWD